ncbi:MAG: 5-Nucleotidase domain protein [Bacteroidetes bacterium]|nr:5-Nucleotidase domain protein [Bacteroidota bacterium]
MTRRISILIIVHILLLSCSHRYIRKQEKFEHYSLKDSPPATLINDSIARFKKEIQVQTSRVIGVATEELVKEGHESTLGNFACAALLHNSSVFPGEKVDVVILNRGGLRANLPKGEIKVGNIFELMPFDNELVLLSIKGEDLLKFIPLVIEKKHPFYGLTLKIKDKQAVSVLVGGKPVNASENYVVLTSDYLANGGDSFTFLANPVYKKSSGLKIRDAMIHYCDDLTKSGKPIKSEKDGRLEISK